MIYTSGTTGQPKGALHGHRVLAGHLPGVRFSHGGFPRPDDLMWTPADWAWAGGLLNAVLPALAHGVPVVARRGEGFDADGVFRLLRDHPVTRAFIPPTALRMLRAAAPEGCGPLHLRSVTAAGEALGAETRDWAERALGCAVDDVYGQTECNYVLGSAASRGAVRRGAIGRATPGHTVAVLRPDGTRCAPGEPGGIAVRRPDPTLFLGYWNRPEATAAKFIGDWMTTGDQATMDRDGYVSFLGRDDDIITSSGFRIGPVEIEETLLRHPGRGGGGRRGPAGRAAHRDRQGLRGAARGRGALRRPGRRHQGLRAPAPVGPRISARRGLRRRPADDDHRQGDARGAARAGVNVNWRPGRPAAPPPGEAPPWPGRTAPRP